MLFLDSNGDLEIPEFGCGCNEFGSENSTCNDWGQCTCKCNVEGDKCDHCSAGYFGLSSVSPSECHGIIQNYKYDFYFILFYSETLHC